MATSILALRFLILRVYLLRVCVPGVSILERLFPNTWYPSARARDTDTLASELHHGIRMIDGLLQLAEA